MLYNFNESYHRNSCKQSLNQISAHYYMLPYAMQKQSMPWLCGLISRRRETAHKCEESLIYVSKQQTPRERRLNLLKCKSKYLTQVKSIHVCQAITKVGVSINRCTAITLAHPYIKNFQLRLDYVSTRLLYGSTDTDGQTCLCFLAFSNFNIFTYYKIIRKVAN